METDGFDSKTLYPCPFMMLEDGADKSIYLMSYDQQHPSNAMGTISNGGIRLQGVDIVPKEREPKFLCFFLIFIFINSVLFMPNTKLISMLTTPNYDIFKYKLNVSNVSPMWSFNLLY